MKQKRLNTLISILVASAFLFVQLPLSMFHDHGHKTNCVYTGGSESSSKTAKHFHANTTKPCFVCAVSLVKDFVSMSPSVEIKTNFSANTFSSSVQSYLHFGFSLRSPRAPPAA